MKRVDFIQYLRPNGEKRSVYIECPDEIAEKAAHIQLAGYRLECEEFSNGLCSFTVTNDKDGDIAVNVCRNGPDVIDAVNDLITDCYIVLIK